MNEVKKIETIRPLTVGEYVTVDHWIGSRDGSFKTDLLRVEVIDKNIARLMTFGLGLGLITFNLDKVKLRCVSQEFIDSFNPLDKTKKLDYKKLITIEASGRAKAVIMYGKRVAGVNFFGSFIRTTKAIEKSCIKAHEWADERIALCARQETGESNGN